MTVRIPDIRFGRPDANMSGFQRVRLSDVRLILICPDFRHIVQPEGPITGHLCPDFRRSRPNRFQTGLEPVLVLVVRLEMSEIGLKSFPTGRLIQPVLKPVWNRFWSRTSEIRTILSGYRTFVLYYMSEIRTDWYQPDVR